MFGQQSLTEESEQYMVCPPARSGDLCQLPDSTVQCLLDGRPLTVVDADKDGTFTASRPGDGHAERVERAPAASAVFGVESHEAMEGRDLLW